MGPQQMQPRATIKLLLDRRECQLYVSFDKVDNFLGRCARCKDSFYAGLFQTRDVTAASFEDKLSRFLKDSDERLLDLKRNVESKRGGRGARRTD